MTHIFVDVTNELYDMTFCYIYNGLKAYVLKEKKNGLKSINDIYFGNFFNQKKYLG